MKIIELDVRQPSGKEKIEDFSSRRQDLSGIDK